jgi:hypothetical protein
MPYLETPQDLAEDIADKLGIYGNIPENDEHLDNCNCRLCFVEIMIDRIKNSVINNLSIINKE